ncbi:hypothetical protein [Winogradskyella psychrotolerans]|uniref:hypothetical protein n=1 Tax=Winogradskyella psychrotolerans TaxID=1344585 RepID=UPI001C07AC96|nr:hypothetical protein [Winogradskyella psychrotolerans]MBU2927861.1 hypothetical protein [Winogradskyella psychrotolerans]
MSKLIALTYSFLILFQSFNISLEDLSKLSTLLEHADYHKEMYGDNFVQFLAEHYGDTKADHANDHEEHKDLPFKGTHHFCSHVITPFITPTVTFDLSYYEFIKIPFNFHYTESHTNFEKSSVFQPPKHA